MKTRTCTDCGDEKPIDQFYKGKRYKGGIRSQCRQCAHAASRIWKAANIEKSRAYDRKAAKKRRLLNLDKCREEDRRYIQSLSPEARKAKWFKADIKRRHGLAPIWYANKLAEQGGGCGICGSLVSGIDGRRHSIDHNHATGEVRGILCNLCNHAIERIETHRGWEERARKYLDHYESIRYSGSGGEAPN